MPERSTTTITLPPECRVEASLVQVVLELCAISKWHRQLALVSQQLTCKPSLGEDAPLPLAPGGGGFRLGGRLHHSTTLCSLVVLFARAKEGTKPAHTLKALLRELRALIGNRRELEDAAMVGDGGFSRPTPVLAPPGIRLPLALLACRQGRVCSERLESVPPANLAIVVHPLAAVALLDELKARQRRRVEKTHDKSAPPSTLQHELAATAGFGAPLVGRDENHSRNRGFRDAEQTLHRAGFSHEHYHIGDVSLLQLTLFQWWLPSEPCQLCRVHLK